MLVSQCIHLKTITQTLHGTAIYAYIGEVLGVNVSIYMECMGHFGWENPSCPVLRLQQKVWSYMYSTRRQRFLQHFVANGVERSSECSVELGCLRDRHRREH